MIRRKSTLVVFFLLATSLGVSAQRPESAAREREEYAVYSAIVPYTPVEAGIIIIANPTRNLDYEPKLKDFQFYPPAPELSPDTLDDFVIRNRTNRWLVPKLEIKRKYEIVDYREILRLTDMDHPNARPGEPMEEWKNFFREYPSSRAFVSLSRVGFNEQMDQALVHFGWRCPSLCGQWAYILLTKHDGVWKVVSEANRVVS